MTYLGETDFLIEVAKGNVPKHSIENKFGRNPDVDTATDPEDIWDGGGVWAAPTAARTHQITSSDANDTSAGSGARTVTIKGLDGSFALQEETITMNGTADVPTASTYTMIHRMFVVTAGSGAENAGNITATADTDATVTAQISIARNQSLMAIYQVPAATTGFLLRWYCGMNLGVGASANADMTLLVQPTGGVYQVKRWVGVQASGLSALDEVITGPPSYAAKSTIKVQCNTVSANNVDAFGGFDLLLVQD